MKCLIQFPGIPVLKIKLGSFRKALYWGVLALRSEGVPTTSVCRLTLSFQLPKVPLPDIAGVPGMKQEYISAFLGVKLIVIENVDMPCTYRQHYYKRA